MSSLERNLQTVITRSINRIAPLSLALTNWDNVGLIVEPPKLDPEANKVFLTTDLTMPVLEEALSIGNVGGIISYHPPIFHAVKRINSTTESTRIASHCIANSIFVYSPHTSLDNCYPGINDWLSEGLGKCKVAPIKPMDTNDKNEHSNAGIGRIATLSAPRKLSELIISIKKHLGLEHIRVARPRSEDPIIKTVAICAGAGASTLSGVAADLYFTGELSHHFVLDALSKNISVVLCEHTNTERGYLHRLKKALQEEVSKEKYHKDIEFVISEVDEDPLKIV